jgi:Glycosyl transferase family 2/Glycosyltransferase like family 2
VSRAPLSVIVTASGTADDFRACLAGLHAALGPRDEVVCVVPAGRTDLSGVARGTRWLGTIEDTSGDQGVRWALGLAETTRPVVVLLDGDAVGAGPWLDRLAEAFADPDVVAAGPRCHLSYGPQSVALPETAIRSLTDLRAYSRQWSREHRRQVTVVDRLGPVCAAVRRDALIEAGGPALDLPSDVLGAAGRLVVVEDALLAHVGSDLCALRRLATVPQDAPLLSVCMIVKDEEDVLAESLAAAREFADEIVVYDTGSSDRTVEIAREHGAHVIEGYWDDHFGDARNRCLAYCRGQWILWVDADEVADGDPAALREELSTTTARALLVPVSSLAGRGFVGYGVLAPRLFRRAGARWIGRLHEQVVDSITGATIVGPATPDLELAHSGYTDARIAAKDKHARNVHLAKLAEGEQTDDPYAVLNLARSFVFAGKSREALDVCTAARYDEYAPLQQQTLLQVVVNASLGLGRVDEAQAAVDKLRAISHSPVAADFLEAVVRDAAGDHPGALRIAEAFPERAADDRLMVHTRAQLAPVEIWSLCQVGRHREAVELLRGHLERGDLPLGLPHMAHVLESAGTGVAEIADLVPERSLRRLLLTLTQAPPELADDVLDALWTRRTGDPRVLALAARLGAHLRLLRALEWSALLRQYGLPDRCTLRALAANPERSPRDRALAGAIAVELFDDQAALPVLAEALAQVPEEQHTAVLDEMRVFAPGIAAAVVPATS